MLNGVIDNLKWMGKIGSFVAKIGGIALTGVGLQKLWAKEEEKLSIYSKAGFSVLYVAHMASTGAAVSLLLGAEPFSGSVGTALVCTTSLLTNYANFLEAYIAYSLFNKKHARLEENIYDQNIDLQRSIALSQCENENAIKVELLKEEMAELHLLYQRLRNQPAVEELKEIYLSLQQKTQNKIHKKNNIVEYIKEINTKQYTMDKAIQDILIKLNDLNQQIADKNNIFQKATKEKTKNRLQRNINALEENKTVLGIVHIECIKYKKMQQHIQQLQVLLNALEKKKPSEPEKNFLIHRIATLQVQMQEGAQLYKAHEIIDLELNLLETIYDKMENRIEFTAWMQEKVESYILQLEKQLHIQEQELKTIREVMQSAMQHPLLDISKQTENLHQMKQMLVTIKSQLSLEKLNKENNAAKINMSTLSSVIAFVICVIPQGDSSLVLKTLMLSCGLVGGVSSLWNFYQKNLIVNKVAHLETAKKKCLDKEFSFTQATTLPSPRPTPTPTPVAIQVTTPKVRVVLPRAAKEKAKTLIFNNYTPTKTPKRARAQIHKTQKRM